MLLCKKKLEILLIRLLIKERRGEYYMGMKQAYGDMIGKLVSSMHQVSRWAVTTGLLQHWPDLLRLLLQVVVKASSGVVHHYYFIN